MSKKDAYKQKAQSQIDALNADIDKLKAKANEAGADAKIEYHDQIEELEDMQKKASAKLDELHKASGEAWEDLASGVDSAVNALSKAIDSSISRFK